MSLRKWFGIMNSDKYFKEASDAREGEKDPYPRTSLAYDIMYALEKALFEHYTYASENDERFKTDELLLKEEELLARINASPERPHTMAKNLYTGILLLGLTFCFCAAHGTTLSLIHISEPTRPLYISYAVFCLKKKKFF